MKSPFILALSLLHAVAVFGAEFHVPTRHPSLPEALEAAGPGDIVILAPGEYVLEGPALNLKDGIHLLGDPEAPRTVVIRGPRSAGLHGKDLASGLIAGLTFKDFGNGALHLLSSSLRIEECVFIGNTYTDGGAIHMIDSSPQITRCDFEMNVATHAGGAVAMGASSPVFNECRFSGNRAPYGGALDVEGHSEPLVLGGCFFDNVAERLGGAQFVWGNGGSSSLVVRGAIYEGNSARLGSNAYSGIGSRQELESCFFVPAALGTTGGPGEVLLTGETQESGFGALPVR